MAGRTWKVAQLEQEVAARHQDLEREQRVAAHRKAEEARAQRQREQTDAFMREHDLKTVEDCQRFVKKTMRSKRFMRPDPIAIWEKVLANPNATIFAVENAQAALKVLRARQGTREPGEDREEDELLDVAGQA